MHLSPVPNTREGSRRRRARIALCAFAFLASLSAAGGASAAACTNLLASADAVPSGYAAAYNVMSSAKELLVRGTECSTTAAEISVGSGSTDQYIYKKALYWTGSAWQELDLAGSNPVSDTWYRGAATASLPIGQTPRYVLGYVCQRADNEWKCGCSDTTCKAPKWQLQAVQGPAPAGTGVCSATATPPPQAAAAGLTKLAFCDDFSTDTVARGATADARDITGGKKWTTERATWSTVPPTSAESFRFNSDGTLTVQPAQQQYNWFMSSTVLRDNALKGFWINKKPKWYVEIRWKFQKGTSTRQQPAFWSMDACHLYGKPAACRNGYYIEPDFWEYYFAVTAAHYHKEGAGGPNLARCNNQDPSYGVSENQWFTAGTLVTDVPEMKYYKNDQLMFTRRTSTPCISYNGSGMNTASFITELKDGDYPILVGSRDGEIITIDYVRVWLAQ